MRCVSVILVVAALLAPASAAPAKKEFLSTQEVSLWIHSYRAMPDPAAVPAAIRALSNFGAFREPENAGVYVGFLAGVLGSNPAKAEQIIRKILPLPPEDQWMVVRAIAYSGLADWAALMKKLALHMPSRKVMTDMYLAGKLPTLDDLLIDKSPGLMERMRGALKKKEENGRAVLQASPEVLDTLWGYYLASNAYGPISRMIAMLAWTKDRDNIEKITIGNMAKYTLASNGARDHHLLSMMKWVARHHEASNHQDDKDLLPVLNEVIVAAETVEISKIRKEALASIEEFRRKGPGYKRELSAWSQVTQGAIALGCIGAAVAGAVALGLPCVIGGAVSSAAANYMTQP